METDIQGQLHGVEPQISDSMNTADSTNADSTLSESRSSDPAVDPSAVDAALTDENNKNYTPSDPEITDPDLTGHETTANPETANPETANPEAANPETANPETTDSESADTPKSVPQKLNLPPLLTDTFDDISAPVSPAHVDNLLPSETEAKDSSDSQVGEDFGLRLDPLSVRHVEEDSGDSQSRNLQSENIMAALQPENTENAIAGKGDLQETQDLPESQATCTRGSISDDPINTESNETEDSGTLGQTMDSPGTVNENSTQKSATDPGDSKESSNVDSSMAEVKGEGGASEGEEQAVERGGTTDGHEEAKVGHSEVEKHSNGDESTVIVNNTEHDESAEKTEKSDPSENKTETETTILKENDDNKTESNGPDKMDVENQNNAGTNGILAAMKMDASKNEILTKDDLLTEGQIVTWIAPVAPVLEVPHEGEITKDDDILILINDTELCVENGDKAKLSLPDSLEILDTVDGQGVYTTEFLPEGVSFGPYLATTVKEAVEPRYCWRIYRNARVQHYLDGTDETKCNWMRYVNFTRDTANLMAQQYQEQIYFRTTTEISPGTQLLLPRFFTAKRQRKRRKQSKPVATKKQKMHVETIQLPQYESEEEMKEVEFKCFVTSCEKVFKSAAKLSAHMPSHPSLPVHRHACRFCGKPFPSPSLLRTHERVHTGERPFRCKVCHRGFNQAGNMRNHLRTHGLKKVFDCDMCEKNYINLKELKYHQKEDHGDSVQCKLCEKNFETVVGLQEHEKTMHGTNSLEYSTWFN